MKVQSAWGLACSRSSIELTGRDLALSSESELLADTVRIIRMGISQIHLIVIIVDVTLVLVSLRIMVAARIPPLCRRLCRHNGRKPIHETRILLLVH